MTVRIELHIEAFNALRNSPEVVGDLERRALAIAEAAANGSPAGAEFDVNNVSNATRGRIRIVTANRQARQGEADDAALTRAIDAGRG